MHPEGLKPTGGGGGGTTGQSCATLDNMLAAPVSMSYLAEQVTGRKRCPDNPVTA